MTEVDFVSLVGMEGLIVVVGLEVMKEKVYLVQALV